MEPAACALKDCILPPMGSPRLSFGAKHGHVMRHVMTCLRWHSGADVAVCTIEKASALLNRLLEEILGPSREGDSRPMRSLFEEDSFGDVGVVVVDEIHLLGEKQRGYLLELILIKVRLSAAQGLAQKRKRKKMTKDVKLIIGKEKRGEEKMPRLQIIGLSATIPNVKLLSDWLEATLYVCHERPVPLNLSLAPRVAGRPRDPDGLVYLVQDTFLQKSCL